MLRRLSRLTWVSEYQGHSEQDIDPGKLNLSSRALAGSQSQSGGSATALPYR